MTKLKRSAAALLVGAALAGTTVVNATSATALSYKCAKSTMSIDDLAYDGPWADNWDFTVRMCSARSGSYIYAYPSVTWDGPVYGINDNTGLFDDAFFRMIIRKKVSGSYKVVKNYYYYGIEDKLEESDSNGNYNGSFRGATYKYKVGSAKAVSDGQLMLDWNNDGNSNRYYEFAASPAV